MDRAKLTLKILREVIKEAKNQKINISHITEEWLKAHTLVGKTNGSLHDAYHQLFESIVPLLSEFNCPVKIANGKEKVPNLDDEGNEYEIERSLSIFLMPDGSFYIDEHDRYFKEISKIASGDFLDPKRILTNLVDTLASNKEARREKMREILLAKNIVDAISKSLVEKSSAASSDQVIQDLKMISETTPKKYRRKKYRKATSEEPKKKPKRRVRWK